MKIYDPEFSKSRDFAIAMIMIVVMFAFPFVLKLILACNLNKLDDKKSVEKFGNLYNGNYVRKKKTNWMISGLWYYPMFLARRFIFVLIPSVLWIYP